jgi:23S rRNA pseudouridine2605 synthase
MMKIQGETERLQKVLAKAGIASRRVAETMIAQGRIMVNGAKVTTPGMKFDPLQDHIKVDGKHIPAQTKSTYLLINKPMGMITSVSDPDGRPTVMKLVPKGLVKERLFPVGRLDYNTEGLLLLTNDGEMAHKLMHPRYGIRKNIG